MPHPRKEATLTPRHFTLGVRWFLAVAVSVTLAGWLSVGAESAQADLDQGCHGHQMYPKFGDRGDGYVAQGRAHIHNCHRRKNPHLLSVGLQWYHPDRGWSAQTMVAHASGAEDRNWVWVSYGWGINCPSRIKWRSWWRIDSRNAKVSDPITYIC